MLRMFVGGIIGAAATAGVAYARYWIRRERLRQYVKGMYVMRDIRERNTPKHDPR